MNLQKIRPLFFLIFFCLLFESKFCLAQTMDSIHYSWQVFEIEEIPEDETEPVKRCYVMSSPQESKSSYTGDRKAYLAISRFESNRSEEVSISADFEFKISSKVYTIVGNKNFEFFTNGNAAWLNDKFKDKEFIQEMLKSNMVKVRSDSSTGAYAVDTYSLKGFARAYKRMRDLCP